MSNHHEHSPIVEELTQTIDQAIADWADRLPEQMPMTIPLEALTKHLLGISYLFDGQVPPEHLERMEKMRPALATAISQQIAHFCKTDTTGTWYPHDIYIALLMNVLHWINNHRSSVAMDKGEEAHDQDLIPVGTQGDEGESAN